MVSVEITYSYPSRNSKCDNYYYNRPSRILKRAVFRPLYFTFLKLLAGKFSSTEI